MREFVVERILSVYLYCGVIFLFFLLIRQSRGYLQLRNLLCIYTIVLTILAFFYIPSMGADVHRLMIIGNDLSNLPWDEFFEWVKDKSTPLAFVYLRLIQSLNTIGALSGITTFVTFSLIFSSVYTVAKNLHISNRSVSYYVFFFMCAGFFFDVIAGVRFALATAIMVNGMIAAWYGKRSNLFTIISLIISCLIHTGLIPIAAFLFLTLFLGKSMFSYFWLKSLIVVGGTMLIGVLSFYIDAAFNKYNSYSGGGASFGIPMYVMSIISFGIYLDFFIVSKKNGFLGILNESNKWMLIILTLFEFFVIRDFVIFARYQCIFPLVLMPYLLCYAEKFCNGPLNEYSNKLFSFGLLKLTMGYLSGMSGMKFFILQ